jgi:hypothetical protein
MVFTLNKPFESPKPAVVVDKGLAPGEHRFRLVVVNAAGVSSKPVDVIVIVEPGRLTIPGGTITNPGPIVTGPIGPVGPIRPTPP